MSSIKDRNGMDLTEAEDIKKKWHEYTELYKKEIHASIGTIKDKNGKDLTEEEKIKNRYMEELYKKVLMTQVIMMVCSLI